MTIEKNTATVYLIDDELAIRDSMTLLIESVGLKIKTYASATAFLNNLNKIQLGCLILELKIPGIGGLELQEELSKRNIHIPIIFISSDANIIEITRAFRAGAFDFVEKPFEHTVLLQRIYQAIEKDCEFRNLHIESEKVKSGFDSLTPREKQVLKLIIDNNSSKQVAKLLAVSPRTIDAHRSHIIEKMHENNILALVSKVSRYPCIYQS